MSEIAVTMTRRRWKAVLQTLRRRTEELRHLERDRKTDYSRHAQGQLRLACEAIEKALALE